MAALITVACLLAVLAVALSGFLLWLSCKICRVVRPSAAPGGKPVGVSYRRALLCAVGLAIVGNATGVALEFAFSRLFPMSSQQTLSSLLLFAVVSFVLVLAVEVLFLRSALPASLGKSLLVILLSDLFAVVVAVGLYFGIRATLFEAYVLPTGSMADTLRGYHKQVVCPQCGYEFAVNCSQQINPSFGAPVWIGGCTCPNCREHVRFAPPEDGADADAVPDPEPRTGDRILVGKGLFGPAVVPPRRLDLIVFDQSSELPDGTQTPPQKYVKRLVGLSGETVAIHGGHLYILPPDKGPRYDDPKGEELARPRESMHVNDPKALDSFKQGAFEIVRKSPAQVLAMRAIVYDNDHPANDLLKGPPRWADRDKDAAWKADDAHGFRLSPADDKAHWLGYRHLLRGHDDKPQLITDFLDYNSWESRGAAHQAPGEDWVGDLMLDCEVQADQPQGELTLELSKGVDRFRARWDLASGACTLLRVRGGKEEALDSRPTTLKIGAAHRVRFADVDERLTVWVDDALPFGDGVTYTPPENQGPTKENDLERPAGVGVRGTAATVRGLKLWRDVYYTAAVGGNPSRSDAGFGVNFGDSATWEALGKLPMTTYYVRPECYFVLGDNSSESSDSRDRGLVPRRLLLGKAFLVYYPLDRAGWLP